MTYLKIVMMLVACTGLAGIGFGKSIDFSNRTIAAEVTPDSVLSGTLVQSAIPASQSLEFVVQISAANAVQPFALFLPGVKDADITVNGRRLELVPVGRSDGLIYMIDSSYLQAGTNTLHIDRDETGSWAGTVLFLLKDHFEQDHFGHAFGEPNSTESGEKIAGDLAPSTAQDKYDVLWYDCTWKPNMFSAALLPGSEVTMGAQAVVNGLQAVELDFDMNINGNGGLPMVLDFVDSGAGTSALSYSYNNSNFKLTVNLPAPVNAGTQFKIRVGYHGAPNNSAPNELFGTNPFYANSHLNQDTGQIRPVVYSVSQPYGGRRWWPSKDHQSDKATTTVQRIVVPNNLGYTLTAISNGVLENTVPQGTNTTYIWRNSYPIATYLMSLAISEYVYTGGTYLARDGLTTMPVGHWIYPDNVDIEGMGYAGTLQAMNFFADKFGEYPFLNEKYHTATWNVSYAIEHQTCTSMPANSPSVVGVGNGLTRRNIHELAHQWFGNKLTCASWDHVWLQEGMATYCEALMYEHLDGKAAYHNYVNGWSPSFTSPVVSSSGDNFDNSTVYRRGAWVFHMLRHAMGDDAFFAGCRAYIASGYTTALSQQSGGGSVAFQTKMEEGAGLAPGSLTQFFDQWLYSPNTNYAARPDYSFSAAYDVDAKNALIRIEQKQGRNDFAMPVDIRLTDADSNTTTIVVPAGASSLDAPLGTFYPVTAELDPDVWIMRRLRANINTASLTTATVGVPYNFILQGSTGSGGLSWSKLSGAPWINVASNGTISGTPPSTGMYSITVRLTNSGNTQDATFDLVVAPSGPPPPAVVINEVSYENSQVTGDDADTAEYVELLNTTGAPVNISGWQVLIVDGGTGEASGNSVTIPGATTLAAGDYYVIGNASTINAVYGNVVDYSSGWNEALPDGNPTGIVVKTASGTFVDSLVYRSDSTFAAGSQASIALTEGGTGRAISAAITNTALNVALGRLPNGMDSGRNLQDFASIVPSPGSANTGITLPFADDFNSGVRAEWRTAFQSPVRTAAPGLAGKPPIPATPSGGNFLEIYDSTGGGDVNFLSGAFSQLNVQGYIWLPATSANPWSTGVGIGTRVESGWFSSSTGFGLENGFYLEYQNGQGVGLKNGKIPDVNGQARLIAANASACPGVGITAFSATTLGIPVAITGNGWQPFRLFYDQVANALFARVGNQVIFEGEIPTNLRNVTGGVTIGFRENHPGNPGPGTSEGTWVDDILINSNVMSDSVIADYYLY